MESGADVSSYTGELTIRLEAGDGGERLMIGSRVER